jgi:hypothetical protein
MAAVTGVALAAVGCSDGEREGMCASGGISLATGALVAAGGIMLILDAQPRADVFEAGTLASANVGGVTVGVGPGFVAGKF